MNTTLLHKNIIDAVILDPNENNIVINYIDPRPFEKIENYITDMKTLSSFELCFGRKSALDSFKKN